MNRDYDTQRIHEAPVTTVRITPRDEAGQPDHRWAFTLRFDDPVFLATIQVTPAENIGVCTRDRLIIQSARVYGAFIADDEVDTDPLHVQTLGWSLWQRRHHGAAVEAWAEIDPATWTYRLIPSWHDDCGTDRWTVDEPANRQVFTVGKISTVDSYPWPHPAPLLDAPQTSPGSHYLMGVTPVRPPTPGYALKR